MPLTVMEHAKDGIFRVFRRTVEEPNVKGVAVLGTVFLMDEIAEIIFRNVKMISNRHITIFSSPATVLNICEAV